MKKLWLLALFILVILIIKWLELDAWLTFENLKVQQESLSLYVQAHYILSVILFMILYILCIAFMLPVATVLTLSGGFLFGAWLGMVFVNIAATIGALIAFLLARYLIGHKIQQQYAKQLHTFNSAFEQGKYAYLFSLRLLPIFPFFLVNLLCGVTAVDIRTFVVTTSLGIIPGTLVYTYAGSQLAKLQSMEDIFSKEIFLALVLLVILILLPQLYKKIKKGFTDVSK